MREGLVIVLFAYLTITHCCTTDHDCQFNGVCIQDRCQCDPGWEGDQCGVLSLVPVKKDAGFRQNSSSSWGGSIFIDPSDPSTFHLYASEMADHCSLDVWRSNSQVVHAVSKGDPTGPYTRVDVAVAPEAHNPQVIRAPDGTYLLFDSYGGPISCPTKTVNCVTTNYCPCIGRGIAPFTFHSSSSPTGPWTSHKVDMPYPCHSCNLTPSPFFAKNGTLYIMFHCDDDSSHAVCDLTMVMAANWKGPYQMVKGGNPVWFANQSPGHPEDPFMWIDSRNNWHVLMHNGAHGIHVFSTDGLNFTIANNNRAPYPYTTDISVVGGTLHVNRRERPWILMDKGIPSLLVTSIMPDGGGNTFTHVQSFRK